VTVNSTVVSAALTTVLSVTSVSHSPPPFRGPGSTSFEPLNWLGSLSVAVSGYAASAVVHLTPQRAGWQQSRPNFTKTWTLAILPSLTTASPANYTGDDRSQGPLIICDDCRARATNRNLDPCRVPAF
jgi:hypothetical protein